MEYQTACATQAGQYAITLQGIASVVKTLSSEQLAAVITTTRARAAINSTNDQRLLLVLEEAMHCGAGAGEFISAAATEAVQQARRQQEQLGVLKDAMLPATEVPQVERGQALMGTNAPARVSPTASTKPQPAATGKKRRRRSPIENDGGERAEANVVQASKQRRADQAR